MKGFAVLLPGVLLIAYSVTPFLLTVAALVMWRKTLPRPWVFGVFGFLAITGLQYLVRPLAEFLVLPSFASHSIITRERPGEIDPVSIGKFTGHVVASMEASLILAIVLLVALGVPLLFRLRTALQRP
jgi:hypothetical protein